MATQSYLVNLNSFHSGITGWNPSTFNPSNFGFGVFKSLKHPSRRNVKGSSRIMRFCSCYTEIEASTAITFSTFNAATAPKCLDFDVDLNSLKLNIPEALHTSTDFMTRLMILADLDPGAAKFAIGFLGPFLSVFGFLFIIRIVMSWYPKLPVGKFPYVIAYAPTEPLLIPTRKVIPPLAGVDVTPVVWFGLLSFLNEILVGPQGLLVLLSQQVNN
ncbi:protein COFACTOR ASSEMBLY OF COMPLEX C SUBUNIT B CCB3, chloroplastic [Cicer arietinum]|uniref:Protein COFACTOR ASSEMBLY OF COMPLEX C SUBUNIT B CCB3, chloroplastic isoform X2 n=1 Tax=Cicer arietinum TaxID=3827 RepID=A0A1S2XZK1_CICAR|nr:protein COFACTOR ASSEMBLY OF COMPLEX C SUBUNIT B CCB3, chloroplastic isoform X2 [Cicer arietinum]